jgi:ribosomal protein L10
MFKLPRIPTQATIKSNTELQSNFLGSIQTKQINLNLKLQVDQVVRDLTNAIDEDRVAIS